MVYLILTRAGFDEVQPKLQAGDAVWTAKSVLSREELESLRGQGISDTVFSHDIDPADAGAVAGWTYTVVEHHPNQPIWVESWEEVVARRKQHRSIHLWIYAVLLIISGAFCALGAYAVSHGKQVSESTDVLWMLVFSTLVTLWSRNDERYPVTRSKGDYSYLLMFFFWPVVLLYHATRSRGMEGLLLYLGFVGVYFAPYLVQMAVYVGHML